MAHAAEDATAPPSSPPDDSAAALSPVAPSLHLAPTTKRGGLWGGTTLGSGNAVWLQAGVGFDMDAVLAAQVGYSRALLPGLDASVGVGGNLGIGRAVGGALRVRWEVLDGRNFFLAADVPLSVSSYVDHGGPDLVLTGVEPGVMMSSFLGSHFELFYGGMLRFYYAESTYFVGPQARAGAAFSLGSFTIGLWGNVSEMSVTRTPAMTLFSAALSANYRFGGGE